MADNHIPYQIIRSSRKTISVEITPEGKVLVRCPKRTTDLEAALFVDLKSQWIRAHLKKYENRPAVPVLTAQQLNILADQALSWFPQRTGYLASKVGVTYGRVSIRAQRTRWGSCSSLGNLNFNCLLMLAPEEVRDYVIIHELCHRKEMNHSPRFWTEVESILPGFRMQKKWLKENGSALLSRLPDAQK
jgi:predicted metal-dependent hydrolase